MANKTDTEVIIGGKVFTLSGYGSEEYLQRVASYINGKISEFSKIDGFKRQSLDTQNVLLELNIADDYFKAKEELEEIRSEAEEKERDLYDVKHDLITAQMKVKNLEESQEKLQEENNELQKKIVKLETELKAGMAKNVTTAGVENNTKETIKEAVKEAVEEEKAKTAAEKTTIAEKNKTEEKKEEKAEEKTEEDKSPVDNISDVIDDIPDFQSYENDNEEKELLYERVEDAEVIGDDDFDEQLNNHSGEEKFVQTIDGTAEVVNQNQEKSRQQKKHYGKRR